MRDVARLIVRLENLTPPEAAAEALADALRSLPASDAAWLLFLLSDGRTPRLFTAAQLTESVRAGCGLPGWLLDRCLAESADSADLLAALWPRDGAGLDLSLSTLLETRLPALRLLPEAEQKADLAALWDACTRDERYLLNKLLGGGLRWPEGRSLVLAALHRLTALPAAELDVRLAEFTSPDADALARLLSVEASGTPPLQALPFQHAQTLQGSPTQLGSCAGWQAEWLWGGARAQLILRGGKALLWSVEERGLNGLFPEILTDAAALPDGLILEGDILAWQGERPLGFRELERRLRGGATDVPVIFMATDCLMAHGVDLRGMPLNARRLQAFPTLGSLDLPHFRCSENLPFRGWPHLETAYAECRLRGVDGLMLKREASIYNASPDNPDWWQWKVPPFTVDAVLLYALTDGSRPGAVGEVTFGLWGEHELLPFARIALKDHENFRQELEAHVKQNTQSKQGPVRLLQPVLVGEIAFDGLSESRRHKSGLAVRNSRLLRLRPEIRPADADTLAMVRAWIIES